MTQEQRLVAFAQAVAADSKDLVSTRGSLASLSTTNKTSLVAAINEIEAAAAAAAASGGASINDGAVSGTTTYSSTKIVAEIAAEISKVVGAALAALDTLKELADELTSQGSAASSLVTAVANRVRFDAAQTLTGPEQVTARTNIGAQSAAAIGDPDRDLVAVYTAAKA